MHIHTTLKNLFDFVPTVRKAQTSSKADKQIPKSVKKSIKLGPQIDLNWFKNLSKLVEKSTKIGPKALLERSGGHLGPKMAQDHPKSSKKHFVGPPWTSMLEAQIDQKSIRRRSKMLSCFYHFFN